MNYAEMLRDGYESYRKYVNPLIALRAELLAETTLDRFVTACDEEMEFPCNLA